MKVAGVSSDKPVDPAFGRMQAHLQRVEGEPAIDGDDQFAIQHKCLRREGAQIFQHFGKKRDSDLPDLALISTSPPARNARQRKPSHLGSNCQPASCGQLADQLGFHRRKVERDAELGQSYLAASWRSSSSLDCNKLADRCLKWPLGIAIVRPGFALGQKRGHGSEP